MVGRKSCELGQMMYIPKDGKGNFEKNSQTLG